MALVYVDGISEASRFGKPNEDMAGIQSYAAWMIDGATGLAEEKLTPGDSDAQWFAQKLHERMDHHAADPAPDLRHMAERILQGVSDDWLAYCGEIPKDMYLCPCASGIMMRHSNIRTDFGWLGDCTALVITPQGTVTRLGGDEMHATVDRQNIERYRDLYLAGETDHQKLRAELLPHITKGRRLANTSGGYWVWAPTDNPRLIVNQMQRQSVDTPSGTRILLMSDGFYRLVDVFGKYDDTSLLMMANSRGLKYLLDELRALEEDESLYGDHPRLKPHDDATALLLEIRL